MNILICLIGYDVSVFL